jgi:DNA-binding protein H-NS
MTRIDLVSLSIDELWALHEEIASVLSTKINAKKLKLERRLEELGHKFEEPSARQRRPYPKVHPKYRNPQPPHETWSGRGRQPRWVTEMIDAGKSLDDLRIPDSAARSADIQVNE